MKRVLSLLIIFILFFTSVLGTEIADTPVSKEESIKVAFIYSENIEAFYRKGVDHQLREGLEDFIYEHPTLIKTYFLNTNYETADENRFVDMTEKVAESIRKFDPDYIITFGDHSFYLFLQHFENTTAKVANLCINELNEEFIAKAIGLGNFMTVHRHGISKLLKYIHDNGSATPHFYIVRDVTPRSYRTYNKLREILLENNQYFKITNIEVTNFQELRVTMLGLLAKPRGVIIPLFKSLPDYDTNLVLNWETVISYIVRTNKKHLEVVLNDDGSEFGAAISLTSNHRLCKKAKVKPDDYLKRFFVGDKDRMVILETPDLIINKERLLAIGSPELLDDLGEVDCLKDY